MLQAAHMPVQWRTAGAMLRVDRPLVVGILNVTPDSFWDGGRHDSVEAAVRHAAGMIADGADLIDVGGESTRPGAVAVAAEVETERVVPVVAALRARWPDVPISVDTVKARVAHAALSAGATIVNDVSALRLDPDLGAVIADHGAGVILMHSRGGVDSMARYALADYGPDCVADVIADLEQAVRRARDAGIEDDCMVVDPGLGFSKTTAHSLALLAGLSRVAAIGLPILVGPSRKRFIGEAAGGLPPEQRDAGTVAACVIALLHGARLFRVHDVAASRRALDFAHAVVRAGEDH
jgi:dihydropteroate synthase